MSEACKPHHDLFTTLLALGLIGGLFASYVPQHFRIIHKRSSEGFSPWFLLLGSTSSAAGMLNMWTMQWGVVRCCRYVSAGSCAESLGGVIQTSLQWALFTTILVLYMIYYPPHLKYAEVDINTHDSRGFEHVKTNVKSDHWRLSITLSWVVAIHMAFVTFTTFLLLLSTTPEPSGTHQTHQITLWATFLGVTSAALAAIQYYPQLVHTYRIKLVGALSIPMMIIQSPGAALMVTSIALRPGTDWTSWIMFAVSGIMQAILLVMCLFWKARQRRLGIDDFGHPLSIPSADGPAPMIRGADDGVSVGDAVEAAVEEDVHVHSPDEENARPVVGEETPLLKSGNVKTNTKGWLSWFG